MSTRDAKRQAKVLRALVRLKHSLRADEEIWDAEEQYARLGSEGVVPQLEMTLNEVLGVEETDS